MEDSFKLSLLNIFNYSGACQFKLNTKFDLLGVHNHQTVDLFRLDGKVWSKDIKANVLAFSPNGKLLAVGQEKDILLLDIETGDVFNHIVADLNKIDKISWAKGDEDESKRKDFRNDGLSSYSSGIFGILNSIPKESGQFKKTVFKEQSMEELSFLLVSDKEKLHINASGVLHLHTFNIKDYLTDFPDAKIINIFHSADMSLLAVLFSETSFTGLLLLQTNYFKVFTNEIKAIADMSSRINSLLKYVEQGVSRMNNEYSVICKHAKLNMERLEKVLQTGRKFHYDLTEDTSATLELMILLTSGIPSSCLVKYLSEDLGIKGMQKWTKITEMGYSELSKLISAFVAPGALRLLLNLTEYACLTKSMNEAIGVEKSNIQESIDAVKDFIMRLESLKMVLINETLNFREFSKWLLYCKFFNVLM
jgi:hypothetical protein